LKNKNMNTKLRVWWIPQVPMKKAFYVGVKNPFEAKKILDVLGKYDLFQLENNIKPDFSNAGGLEAFDESENDWFEWEDKDGNNIDNT